MLANYVVSQFWLHDEVPTEALVNGILELVKELGRRAEKK